MANLNNPHAHALHSLWCCGLIRARIDHPGFNALVRNRLVTRRLRGGDHYDYRLTRLGLLVARFNFEETPNEPIL